MSGPACRVSAGARRTRVARPAVLLPAVAAAVLAAALPAAAQTTGSVRGRVVDEETGGPLSSATVEVLDAGIRTLTDDEGRFVLAAVPAGPRTLRFELIGYRSHEMEGLHVRGGRTVEVEVSLRSAPVPVEGVVAEVDRVPLIEPEISATHEVVVGDELEELPVDAIEGAVELTPGVSGGHFRGGRVGQEVYVIDGLELKNRLEASTQGAVMEVSPTSLEELEVTTGGFGAEYGSALSGVVSYVTRRGNRHRWRARASLLTDQWAPDALFTGFSGLSASAGGPVPFLGEDATLFADVLAQGMVDSDPRARGLACLRPGDVREPLAGEIRRVREDRALSSLHCPYTPERLPHQRGEKLIGFLRFDRSLFGSADLTATLLTNRVQRELYTPEFKYHREHQLGQRSKGALATVTVDWNRHLRGSAWHVTLRAAAMRLDRYLGVVDPSTFDGRARVAGFGLGDFRFVGEDFVRSPIDEQLDAGTGVPGYAAPGGATGSPFGPAAEGIFFTEGTPTLANRTRSEFVGSDLVAEYYSADGHVVRGGVSGKLHRAESYERVLAHLPGSAPNYALFYPGVASGFLEVRLAALEDVTVNLGGRVEAFRPGLTFRRDRSDFLAPEVDTDWELTVMPRIGVSAPVPGTEGRTAFRFNYGLVSQPPDFRFFLDTTLGDSLRTDIRRQGNPELTFEEATAYELGVSHVLTPGLAAGVTFFRKDLTNLVTGSLSFSETAPGQFTTGDFGTVQGAELTLRGRWPGLRIRAGYALQKAEGVASTAFDPVDTLATDGSSERVEFPLAFDRRHSADIAVFVGRAAGDPGWGWGAAVTSTVQSGFPLDRELAAGEIDGRLSVDAYLPWTWTVDVRLSRELGTLPGCGGCRWRAVVDGRNILGRENVIALRRETGEVGPSIARVRALAARESGVATPIPFESPEYSARIDFDSDGRITAGELRDARFAAALDRLDPSLFYGEPRQVRIGLEVTFR